MKTGFQLAIFVGATFLLGFPSKECRADVEEDARAQFTAGVKLFEKGDYKAAAEAFREAYNLRASWKMLYNLGQSEAAAGRYGLALEAFESYLVEGKDDVQADRRDEVLKEIERMRLLVGVIDVQAPDGTELVIDGTTRGTTPFSGLKRVEAGPRKVVLRYGGDAIFEETVNIAGGMTTPVKAETGSAAPGGSAPEGVPTEGSAPEETAPGEGKGPSLMLIGGIAAGVAGLAGIGVGSYFAAQGGKDYDDQKAARDAGDTDAFHVAEDRLAVDRVGTIVGFVAGGALLAAGVTLIVVDRVRAHKGGEEAEKEEQAFDVRPAPGGLTVSF
jgi:hypothetical protein